MVSVQGLVWRNPVLYRELKERMGSARVMIVLTLYLLVLGTIVFAIYLARTGERTGSAGQPGVTQIAEVGQSLFEYVLFFMMVLVLFIVPGFTAASIAGERERQTLMPLQVSMLRPRSIIFGKITASVAFTALLLIASLPLLAVAFLIGGITIREVFIGLGVVLFTAVTLACITVACSALTKRVQGAIVLAYGLVLFLVGGTFIAFVIAGEIDSSRGSDPANPTTWILAPNPLAAVADLAGDSPSDSSGPEVVFGPFGPEPVRAASVSSPLSAIRDLMAPDSGQQSFNDGPFFGEPVRIDQFGNPVFAGGDNQAELDDGPLPFWARFGVVFGVMALVGIVISSRRIRTPAKTER